MGSKHFHKFVAEQAGHHVLVPVTFAVHVPNLREFEDWKDAEGLDNTELAKKFVEDEMGQLWVRLTKRAGSHYKKPVSVWDSGAAELLK